MHKNISTIVTALVMSCLLLPNCVAAQSLKDELLRMRNLRLSDAIFDASDYADSAGFRQVLDEETMSKIKEGALWEVADTHLSAANKWPATSDNAYAKRAIDAWTAYLDFAHEQNFVDRIHRAVEYLQRSYIQANDFPAMFRQLTRIPPKYINDKVVTRWEDRLRTCPVYQTTSVEPWIEKSCMHADCRESVVQFYTFLQSWLNEFSLKAELKKTFLTRSEKIPTSCRML